MQYLKKITLSQFEASLRMLHNCVEICPVEHWQGVIGKHAYWHVAYHVLFYADLYLSADESSFQAPDFHREDYEFLGHRPWPPFEEVIADVPYPKETLLGYIAHCLHKARETIPQESQEVLEGPSGFFWLKFTRGELHIYNIRHLQHHAGQLCAYLRGHTEGGVDWRAYGWE